MKDAKGHGSNERGGTKPSAKGMRLLKTYTNGPHSAKVYKNPEWGEHVVQTFRNGAYQSKNDYHTDDGADAHATAQSQLARWASSDKPTTSNAAAAQSLMSGLKSTQAPVHDSMTQNNIDNFKAGIRDSRAKFASQFGNTDAAGIKDHVYNMLKGFGPRPDTSR